MERHPLISSDCLTQVEKRLGSSNFLQMAHEIALYHHERWDGKGYPYGLHGAAIPLSARIVAIADVYDALSSPRVYKPAFPHEECVEMISNGAGPQFDPDLVEVFLSIETRIAAISQSLSNADVADGLLIGQSEKPNANFENIAERTTLDETLESVNRNLDELDDLLGSLRIEPNASPVLAADLVSVS